ncbi:hypothetical protein A9264_05840 [Vibrio sp. UCD-FRSSP16_10]|uniref:SPOR domain-containing protein n=1 Tax=unclassified Vibrio TaxID=2614977 RepID=UPI0007FCA282|nr:MULTISPECIES: SPOR domain-containing protein [unclassified Vibrio]OBT07987.1 hypothetical protein A9260_08080 [Vibrio sp. UCD-FRSSP16_30]OBT17161.1 hypothetical protein A9264_05840 [Vibrio sp. UCD-FRSSP16_10]
MKKTAIVSLALLVTACSSNEYDTDIKSESYQENYQTTQAEVDAQNPQINEQDVAIVEEPAPVQESDVVQTNQQPAQVTSAAVETTDTTATNTDANNNANATAKVASTDVKQDTAAPTKGFSIQLATLSTQEKASAFAKSLMVDSAVWIQSKSINDKPVYSVLMGDFEDYDEAKAAVASLPEALQKLQPFVKNFTDKELAEADRFQLLK